MAENTRSARPCRRPNRGASWAGASRTWTPPKRNFVNLPPTAPRAIPYPPLFQTARRQPSVVLSRTLRRRRLHGKRGKRSRFAPSPLFVPASLPPNGSAVPPGKVAPTFADSSVPAAATCANSCAHPLFSAATATVFVRKMVATFLSTFALVAGHSSTRHFSLEDVAEWSADRRTTDAGGPPAVCSRSFIAKNAHRQNDLVALLVYLIRRPCVWTASPCYRKPSSSGISKFNPV